MLFVPLGTMQSKEVAIFKADSFVVPSWEISHNQADTVLNNSSELTSKVVEIFFFFQWPHDMHLYWKKNGVDKT